MKQFDLDIKLSCVKIINDKYDKLSRQAKIPIINNLPDFTYIKGLEKSRKYEIDLLYKKR